ARSATARTIARASPRSSRSAHRNSRGDEKISAGADREGVGQEAARPSGLAHEAGFEARLRKRPALPEEVRRRGREGEGPEDARRPGEVSIHRQGGPARYLSI